MTETSEQTLAQISAEYLNAGFELAQLPTLGELGPAAIFSRYPPFDPAANIAGRYSNMVLLEVNTIWCEDVASTENLVKLFDASTTPEIVIEGRSRTWLFEYSTPFKRVRSGRLYPTEAQIVTLDGPTNGVLLPPSRIMTTRHALSYARWRDEKVIRPVPLPEALLVKIFNAGLHDGPLTIKEQV